MNLHAFLIALAEFVKCRDFQKLLPGVRDWVLHVQTVLNKISEKKR